MRVNNVQPQSYRKLIVYQKAKDLVLLVYKLTSKFPRVEQYTLVPQLRRAVISVVANIVEGYVKGYSKEFVRFLNISIGSLAEVEIYLELSFELNYFDKIDYDESMELLLEVKKLLYSFQKSLRVKM